MVILETPSEENRSDWVCLEFVTGRKLFLRLPYDPFADTHDGILADRTFVRITEDVFLLMKAMGPDGVARVGILALKEDPIEPAEPPYLLNMEQVCSISKLSPECKLYTSLISKATGVEVSRSSLVIPG